MNCRRDCIRVAALQWLRLAKQARFVSFRDDRQGNRPDLTDTGWTTAVYGHFVHRKSGGKPSRQSGGSIVMRSGRRALWDRFRSCRTRLGQAGMPVGTEREVTTWRSCY
jgi:hypothetical protein